MAENTAFSQKNVPRWILWVAAILGLAVVLYVASIMFTRNYVERSHQEHYQVKKQQYAAMKSIEGFLQAMKRFEACGKCGEQKASIQHNVDRSLDPMLSSLQPPFSQGLVQAIVKLNAVDEEIKIANASRLLKSAYDENRTEVEEQIGHEEAAAKVVLCGRLKSVYANQEQVLKDVSALCVSDAQTKANE